MCASTLAPDEYLSDIIVSRKPGYAMAGRLARMQIITANRRGHILHLNAEGVRRSVTEGLKHGWVPQIIIPCASCSCQAFLFDWLKASEFSPAQHNRVYAQLSATHPAWMLKFMCRCSGYGNVADMLQLTDRLVLASTLR